METSLAEQLQQSFLSCGLGFLLGLYYDLFGVIRVMVPPSRRAWFWQDVCFFASGAVITFLFSLAVMEGQLRSYLFIGEIVGFLAYHLTLGRVVIGVTVRVVRLCLRVWHLCWELFWWPWRALWRRTAPCRARLCKQGTKIAEKALFFLKKLLQPFKTLVYNKK